jgi:leader peptidase (prepilin peptidase)/N-methyltransferase
VSLGWSVVAAMAAGGLFYSLAVITRGKGMGGGDIKLAFVLGLLLGPLSTFVAMEAAFLSAALVGMALWIVRVIKRRAHIPFGPFLVAGTVFAQLYGQSIVRWYLHINSIG